MYRKLLAVPAVILMVLACKPPTPEFPGIELLRFFPFDDNTDCTWEFVNDGDTNLRYSMVAEIPFWEILDDGTHYRMDFVQSCIQDDDPECEDDLLIKQITFAADFRGIRITGVGGEYLDTPIQISENQFGRIGDSVTSESRGNTYTSTFVEQGDCNVRIPGWDNCPRWEITSSNGPDDITGNYYAIEAFQFVALDWDDQPGRWELSRHEVDE